MKLGRGGGRTIRRKAKTPSTPRREPKDERGRKERPYLEKDAKKQAR